MQRQVSTKNKKHWICNYIGLEPENAKKTSEYISDQENQTMRITVLSTIQQQTYH